MAGRRETLTAQWVGVPCERLVPRTYYLYVASVGNGDSSLPRIQTTLKTKSNQFLFFFSKVKKNPHETKYDLRQTITN